MIENIEKQSKVVFQKYNICEDQLRHRWKSSNN